MFLLYHPTKNRQIQLKKYSQKVLRLKNKNVKIKA